MTPFSNTVKPQNTIPMSLLLKKVSDHKPGNQQCFKIKELFNEEKP
jgi:hypothetical protein